MSFATGNVEGLGKRVANDLLINAVALFLYSKTLQGYVVNEADGELLRILKSSGVITGLDQLKGYLVSQGYDLTIFR